MTITWDASFVARPDTVTGLQGSTGEYINQFKAALQERINVEHEFDPTDVAPQANHGIHKEGSAKAFYTASTSKPTKKLDGVTNLDADDEGRLCITTLNDNLDFWLWTGTQWRAVTRRNKTYIADTSGAGYDLSDLLGWITADISSGTTYACSGTLNVNSSTETMQVSAISWDDNTDEVFITGINMSGFGYTDISLDTDTWLLTNTSNVKAVITIFDITIPVIS